MFGIRMDSPLSLCIVALVFILRTGCHAGVISVNLTASLMSAESYWNEETPEHALEGTTCFKGGSETTSYWKIMLPERVTVGTVLITGSYEGELRVRIGDGNNEIGDLRGHDSNVLCRNLAIQGDMTSLPFTCDRPRAGNILSISGTAFSRDRAPNLKLCNIELLE